MGRDTALEVYDGFDVDLAFAGVDGCADLDVLVNAIF